MLPELSLNLHLIKALYVRIRHLLRTLKNILQNLGLQLLLHSSVSATVKAKRGRFDFRFGLDPACDLEAKILRLSESPHRELSFASSYKR